MNTIIDPTATAATSYQKGKAYFDNAIRSGKILNCSPGYVAGNCPGGHRFAAVQFCGREYCPDCSRDGSPIHQRRVKKGWQNLKDHKKIGYFVLTIPENLRYLFYDKTILRDFRFKILRKLKEDYNLSSGFARWHWFGDCQHCGGAGCIGCNNTGAGNYWHPHLNILAPGTGYIDDLETYLKPLRLFMAGYFKKLLNKEIEMYEFLIKQTGSEELMTLLDDLHYRKSTIKSDLLVVNYSYASDEKKIMNMVKYVTRSTFKIYDESVKSLLYNFRNTVCWGWKKSDCNIDENIQEPVYCPACKAAGVDHIIKWGGLNKFKLTDKIKKNDTTEQQRRNSNLYYIRGGIDEHYQRDPSFIQVQLKRSKKFVRDWAGV